MNPNTLRQLSICVLGAGAGGLALAGDLIARGHRVRLWNRTAARLAAVESAGGIVASGIRTGVFPPDVATTDIGEALAGCGIVIVATTADVHGAVAQLAATHRSEHHSFILSPGKTGGALLFRRALAAVGEAPSLRIAEAQSMVFASRQREAGVDVIAEKARVPVAALPNDEDPDWLGPAVDLFPAWQQVDNVLETSFENIGSVLHPILTLLNAAAVEHRDDGLMYHRTPPRIAAALEALDAERRAAALAYGIATHSLSEWISTAYPGGSGSSLVEQLDETMAYRSVALPDSLDSRFLTEDVPTGLVPLHAFGAAAGVHMPLTASVIHMCCAVLDRDFWREGRNLAALGLGDMSPNEIRRHVGVPD